MAAKLVWLASYPKCGNTWLRGFIAACLSPDGRVNLDALDTSMSAHRLRLDEALGISTSDLTGGEIRELLPFAWRNVEAGRGLARFVKTHDAFGYTSNGAPLFPAEVTDGVVHLVRDPRDILVSLHHHRGTSLDETLRRLNNRDEWIAEARGPVGPQVPQFLSDWTTHTRSWLESPLRRLTLRYEDLVASPIAAFRQVVEFCDLDVDERRLAAAVSACSFEQLQEQEAAKGFRERPARASAPFFREGRAGAWRDVLSTRHADEVVAMHGDMMGKMGYPA